MLSNESKAALESFDRVMNRGFWIAVALAVVGTFLSGVLIG